MALYLVCIPLSISMVATTVAATKAFLWLRQWARPVPTLAYLVSCPYCLGVWLCGFVTLGMWFASAPGLTGIPVQNQVVAAVGCWAALSWVTGVSSGLLCWALGRMDALHGGVR